VKDRDFDGILEKWAEYEAASAPDLSPTPAMYQTVLSFKHTRQPAPFFRRWLALSAAAAALLILAVIYPAVFGPSPGAPGWSGRELEIVGLREMPVSEKGTARTPVSDKAGPQSEAVSPKPGKKGPAHLFRKLEFQFRAERSPAISSLDVRGPREETISLTSTDSYRLLMEPVDDVHTYVFQLAPPGILIDLFPNETYSPYRNPLGGKMAYHLPPEANWFHPGLHRGEHRLYLLASTEPLGEVERLYGEYTGEISRSRRAAVLSELLRLFDSIMAGGSDHASGWMLPFHHR
jgi:hypothetical protein